MQASNGNEGHIRDLMAKMTGGSVADMKPPSMGGGMPTASAPSKDAPKPSGNSPSKPSGASASGMTSNAGKPSNSGNGPDWKVAGQRALTVLEWVGKISLIVLSVPLLVLKSITQKPWVFLLLGIVGGLGATYGFGINVEGYWDQFTDSATPFMLKPGVDDGARFENFFANLGTWPMAFAIGISLLIQGVQSFFLSGMMSANNDKNTAKKLGMLFWFFFAIDACVAFANYPWWGVGMDVFFRNLVWFAISLVGADFLGAFALYNLNQFGKGFKAIWSK